MRHYGAQFHLNSFRDSKQRISYTTFYLIKFQRLDMVVLNKVKANTGEVLLVTTISKDVVSTKRA